MTITILSILGGFLALILGALKDFGGYGDSAVTAFGVALLAIGVAKEWISMRRDLAPMRARHALRLCVYVPTHLDAARVDGARELCAQLRTLGFSGVSMRVGAQDVPSNTQAAVVYHPAEDEAVRAIEAAPSDSRVLVLAHGMVKAVRLSERVTAANSVMRLVLDLGAVAELEV